MKSTTLKKQAGMTLTESLLVLAVGALVAVLAYGGYKMATGNIKSQSSVESVGRLFISLKKTFGSSGNYTGITEAKVVTAGIVPSDFTTAAADPYITAPFGGKVTIAVNGTDSKMADVTFAAVPADICMDLLAGVEGNVEIITMSDGATKPKDLTAATPVRYTPSTAADKCNTGGSLKFAIK